MRKIKFNDNEISIDGDPIPFYPIGAVIMTTDPDFDPEVEYGGFWERIEDRFLIGAGGSFVVKEEGGSISHSHTLGDGFAKINIGWDDNQNCLSQEGRGVSWFCDRKTTTNGQTYNLYSSRGCATALGGSTDGSSELPPYYPVYIWERIAKKKEVEE